MEFLLPKHNSKLSAKMTSKEFDKKEAKERKRGLLYLIEGYLRDCCLHDAADAVVTEAQLTNQYELCENIDLEMILQDYNSYYYARFDKYPRILRKINQSPQQLTAPASATSRRSSKSNLKGTSNRTSPPLKQVETPLKTSNSCDLQIDVTYLSPSKTKEEEKAISSSSLCSSTVLEERGAAGDKDRDNRTLHQGIPMRPSLCDFEGYSSEWREMADLITREIVTKNCLTSWDDCVGLEHAAELLREAVIYPLAHPELFDGLLTPWRGVLLFGPPGTGKTLLARALAAETASTFINLTISTFVSKWRGESEKMLKVLFDVARLYAPTTIFIDELDALASKHEDNQHDASRRFRSELLVQLDGLLHSDDKGIFVLATTNSPWNLCRAVLRRFEKRILVNVPDQDSRTDLFKYYFNKHPANNFSCGDYSRMAEATKNFSGADVRIACREVAMITLREKFQDGSKHINYDRKSSNLRTPTMDDVFAALSKMHPTNDETTIKQYLEWAKLYSCT